jgi:hypothetical protein
MFCASEWLSAPSAEEEKVVVDAIAPEVEVLDEEEWQELEAEFVEEMEILLQSLKVF